MQSKNVKHALDKNYGLLLTSADASVDRVLYVIGADVHDKGRRAVYNIHIQEYIFFVE